MIDWAEIRKQFPVTTKLAYLNSAAAGPVSEAAQAAATDYYQKMMSDGDVHWNRWLAQRENIRERIARFINAEPDEIAFTTNTSSGMNLIVDALEERGEVISSELEFPVTTLPWMHRRIPVHLLPAVDGEVRMQTIRDAMTHETGIIALSHVQFSNGFRIDLDELGKNKGDHVLVVNASQSAGAFEIDVKRMQIDALCATGHKWMLAGYGSGFVYLSRNLLQQTHSRALSWLSVEDPFAMRNDELRPRHDAAARIELGCPHFAGIFALGAAVKLIAEIGMGNIQRRVIELNQKLTTRLAANNWKILSPLANDASRSGETLIAVDHSAEVVRALFRRGVVVTEKPEGIRAATHLFNDESDIERLMAGLNEIRAQTRLSP
ncbi:MAG TPA: aminotransferase class V-fold PLP-dependent enzyme [Pyrinomonadaceae bacterium]|nr:aminotransferase class V-fold PLP-dependent enzyme [Pyrinomonadaceae bacterium]